MSLDDIPLSTILEELATTYETVAALPPMVERIDAGGSRSRPGSRVPPGLGDVLDEDEYHQAVHSLDDWAEFVAHVVLDEKPGIGAIGDSTPSRLRLASRWPDVLWSDRFLGYAIEYDAREHLVTMRRLAKRGTRVVHTGSACLTVTCSGQYQVTIDGPGEVDGDLVCSGCGEHIPREMWERWGSRSEWVTAAHVANVLGLEIAAVWQRAKREGWRRQGHGRTTRYHRDDAGVSSATSIG